MSSSYPIIVSAVCLFPSGSRVLLEDDTTEYTPDEISELACETLECVRMLAVSCSALIARSDVRTNSDQSITRRERNTMRLPLLNPSEDYIARSLSDLKHIIPEATPATSSRMARRPIHMTALDIELRDVDELRTFSNSVRAFGEQGHGVDLRRQLALMPAKADVLQRLIAAHWAGLQDGATEEEALQSYFLNAHATLRQTYRSKPRASTSA